MSLFGTDRRQPGWMALQLDEGEMLLVHGSSEGFDGDEKAAIAQLIHRPIYADKKTGLAQIAKELDLKRYRRSAVLRPGDYQMLLVEAPKVIESEIKAAVRWQVKDLLDHPIDDVTLDVLDIPKLVDDAAAPHFLYVVAAANAAIAAHMEPFELGRLPLDVIEIPETAQRNLSRFLEQPDEAGVVLHLGERSALLTITVAGNLYMSRRIDVPYIDLSDGSATDRSDARSRLTLELQRTLDHFERQYRNAQINRMFIAPEPAKTNLATHLQQQLGIPVERINLAELLPLPEEGADSVLQWRYFHLVGATLRTDPSES